MNQDLRMAIAHAIVDATINKPYPVSLAWERRADAAAKATIDWLEQRTDTMLIDYDKPESVMAWMREEAGV